jgi:hypothetical protein
MPDDSQSRWSESNAASLQNSAANEHKVLVKVEIDHDLAHHQLASRAIAVRATAAAPSIEPRPQRPALSRTPACFFGPTCRKAGHRSILFGWGLGPMHVATCSLGFLCISLKCEPWRTSPWPRWPVSRRPTMSESRNSVRLNRRSGRDGHIPPIGTA